jgi:hypothetical protein
MHVPTRNLFRYRHLKSIYDHIETAADHMGSEFPEDANKLYALAGKYRRMAEELRAKPEDYHRNTT